VILCDVNVLLMAHKRESVDHLRYKRWLLDALNGDELVGCSDLVLSGVLRLATNRRVFSPASTLDEALEFVEVLRGNGNVAPVGPGPQHWEIFTGLCRKVEAKGNLVPDAYVAALAIEHGCEWITGDRDFARFPGLRWRHPLG